MAKEDIVEYQFTSDQSRTKAAQNGAKGGKASGEAKRRKRSLREAMQTMLALELSEKEISDLAKKKPNQISGGQQQRVAIARAMVSKADIILADEPTGALDQKTGQELLELMKEINAEGKTIILVTHDINVANVATKHMVIEDGICYQGYYVLEKITSKFFLKKYRHSPSYTL